MINRLIVEAKCGYIMMDVDGYHGYHVYHLYHGYHGYHGSFKTVVILNNVYSRYNVEGP